MKNQNSWVSGGIIIVIIVLINLVAQNLFVRVDFTANERYSISTVTKNILSEIDDPVTVKIYYSEKFPRQLISVKQYVMDMLEEYRAYAGNRLEYEFIGLGSENPEKEREAISYGVQPVQANITESDEIKVQKIFLGIVFLYGDEKEVIPFAQNIEQLEYDMTGAIKKLTASVPAKAGWLTGNGEPELYGQDQQFQSALAEIRKNYQLESVNLTTVEKIGDDISILIVMSPTERFTEADLYKIDQYLMRGGKMTVFANTNRIDLKNQYMPVLPNPQNLNDIFQKYGFSIDNQLVMDKQSFSVQAMQNLGPIQIPVSIAYPLAPRLTNFNADNPIVSRMKEVGFFFVSRINTTIDSANTQLSFTPLVSTSDKTGFAMPDPRTRMININPSQEYPDFLFREKNLPVAAVVDGMFNSAYGNATPDTIIYPDPHRAETAMAGKIVVVGCGTLADPQFMVPSSMTFLLNTLDWLYDEHGLISIRSKNINPPQLETIEPSTKAIIKWVNILLAPILIVLFGIIRWMTRRKVKQLAGGRV